MWFLRLSWVVTLFAACAAAVEVAGIPSEASAPQAAALIARGLAIAIIPYVFTRAVEAMLMLHRNKP